MLRAARVGIAFVLSFLIGFSVWFVLIHPLFVARTETDAPRDAFSISTQEATAFRQEPSPDSVPSVTFGDIERLAGYTLDLQTIALRGNGEARAHCGDLVFGFIR